MGRPPLGMAFDAVQTVVLFFAVLLGDGRSHYLSEVVLVAVYALVVVWFGDVPGTGGRRAGCRGWVWGVEATLVYLTDRPRTIFILSSYLSSRHACLATWRIFNAPLLFLFFVHRTSSFCAVKMKLHFSFFCL